MKNSKYTALPLKDKLVNKIMVYYSTVWAEKKFTSTNHKLWLSNFQEDERLNSLYLLSKFMFFGNDEIRELLVSIYRDKFKYKIVQSFRKNNSDSKDISLINAYFEKELSLTRFISLGSASESGAYILFLFRQVNKLSTRYLKSSGEIIQGSKLTEAFVKNYIFIDDFCGSGETAINYTSLIDDIRKLNPKAFFSYYSLFATKEGLENVAKHSSFDATEVAFVLDSSFKCFDDLSRYFSEGYAEIDKTFAKGFSTKYGIPLVKDTPVEGHPLGFSDGQLLLAFSHNTPDNSLPIFWGSQNWRPFFIRYIKTK